MVKHKFFLAILILSFLYITSSAQAKIEFSKVVHNFGIVASQNYLPAVFEFTNTGEEPLAILIVKGNENMEIKYQHKFLLPEEKGRIIVKHNNNKLGEFEEEIQVLTNASDEYITLTIRGENLSVQECFPNKANFNIRKVIVVDTETKEAIPKASVNFIHNFSNKSKGITNKSGVLIKELKIGQYYIETVAENYENSYDTLFVKKSSPFIYIEMTPIKKIYTEPEEELVSTKEEIITPLPIIKNTNDTTEVNTELPSNLFAANNVVFIIDISLSMRNGRRLELLKEAVNNLVLNLREIDKVSIIVYSTNAYTLLTGVNGNEKDTLMHTINRLKPYGITNGVKGLDKGYEIAIKNYVNNGNNQLILATDGEFTGSKDSEQAFIDLISGNSDKGVVLSILGFGVNEEAKIIMSKMATEGKGNYLHINNSDDINTVLIDEIKEKSRKTP